MFYVILVSTSTLLLLLFSTSVQSWYSVREIQIVPYGVRFFHTCFLSTVLPFKEIHWKFFVNVLSPCEFLRTQFWFDLMYSSLRADGSDFSWGEGAAVHRLMYSTTGKFKLWEITIYMFHNLVLLSKRRRRNFILIFTARKKCFNSEVICFGSNGKFCDSEANFFWHRGKFFWQQEKKYFNIN